MAYTATPKKLPDGTWGAFVDGTPEVGDRIRVTTRAGKSWLADVTAIVSRDHRGALVDTKSEEVWDADRGFVQGRAETTTAFRRRIERETRDETLAEIHRENEEDWTAEDQAELDKLNADLAAGVYY